jgi:hypothetical protein
VLGAYELIHISVHKGGRLYSYAENIMHHCTECIQPCYWDMYTPRRNTQWIKTHNGRNPIQLNNDMQALPCTDLADVWLWA